MAKKESINTSLNPNPYYPIDPWSLEGLLFNCAAMGLRVSIIFKISFRDNSRDNYFLKNIGTILGTILRNSLKKKFSIVSKT